MTSVLYVTTTFPTLAAFLENEVHRLCAHGVRVRVLTLRGRSASYQPEHADLLAITQPIGDPRDVRSWVALARWMVRRPHVLVPGVIRLLWASRRSGYALAGHLGYLPAAARVASIAEHEDFDRIHGAWAHFPASVAWLASRLANKRFSMAGHAGSDLYRTQAFLAEKVRAADFVTACVRGNAEMLQRLAGPAARVEWIYHGVDRRRFDGSGRDPAPEPLLLGVGRLADTKGFDVAIRALGVLASRGVRPRLVLVGDGPGRDALERLAHACDVARQVEFLGALEQRDVLALYRRAWLLVSPSRVLANGRRDGIPNVIVEALAMGLPCVGTRVAGIEEVVHDGVNGRVVQPDDPTALAEAIAGLLADPGRMAAMSAAARQVIDESLDADRTFERVLVLMRGG